MQILPLCYLHLVAASRSYSCAQDGLDDYLPHFSALQIYIGLQGLPREERMCQSGKVEDVSHWLLECDAWRTEHQPLLQCMRHSITDFDSLCNDDKLV